MPNTLEVLTTKLPGTDSANIGAVRTTVNAFAVSVAVWVVAQFTDKIIDPSNPLILVGVPLVLGIGYRLSRVVTAKWPSLGWVFFGIGKPPAYVDPPAVVVVDPDVADPPAPPEG